MDLLSTLGRDLKAAQRGLRGSPAYSIGATATLALGIAAAIVCWGLTDGVLLRAIHVNTPQSLVVLTAIDTQGRPAALNIGFVDTFSQRVQGLHSAVSYLGGGTITVEVGPTILRTSVAAASPTYFHALGLQPAAGAWAAADDDIRTDGLPSLVLGHAFWRRHFGAEAAAVGSIVRVEGIPFRVGAVMPSSFPGIEVGTATDVTIPVGMVSRVLGLPPSWPVPVTHVLARLRPGQSIDLVRSEAQTVWSQALADSVPSAFGARQRELYLTLRPQLNSAARGIKPGGGRETMVLAVLAVFSAIVLLVTCANVAALMIARFESRAGQSALRLALGATRAQVIRPLAMEATVLVAIGTVLAVPASLWGRTVVAKALLPRLPGAAVMEWDARAVALVAIIAGTVALGASGLPLWWWSRNRERLGLERPSHTSAPGTADWSRVTLGLQTAAAVGLLAAVVALGRSYLVVTAADPGFRSSGVILATLAPRPQGYDSMDDGAYYRELIDRMARGPHVEAVALSKSLPVSGDTAPVTQPVAPISTPDATTPAALEVVSPGLLGVLGARLEAGREFDSQDAMAAEPVAVVTKALATALFPTGPAVGQYIRYGGEDRHQQLRVVGVVQDLSFGRLDSRTPPIVFVSWFQQPPPYARWPVAAVRFRHDAASAVVEIRDAVASMGREFVEVSRTMDEQIDVSVARERFLALAAALFAVLAATLVLTGFSARLWQDIERRRRERAVRVALGATPAALLRSIVRANAGPVIVGSIVGGPLALAGLEALGRSTGLISVDWVAVVLATLVLPVLSVLLVLWPAVLEARATPASALRAE